MNSTSDIGISIFAPEAYISRGGYLKRVSSMIRGAQIAERIGAKLNPKEGFANDVCIYAKPESDPKGIINLIGKKVYLDIIDGWYFVPFLRDHPDITAIVCSQYDRIWLSSKKLPNRIIMIPQHHCNFNREKKVKNNITTVGIISNAKAHKYLPSDLEQSLKKLGVKLIKFSDFFTRQDVVDFYKKIDIQMVWRPWFKKLSNPIKLVNGASFGIPSIALDEICFNELGNCYIPVKNFDQFLAELRNLMNNPELYFSYSQRCLTKAEDYHIDKIAKLYLDLRNGI